VACARGWLWPFAQRPLAPDPALVMDEPRAEGDVSPNRPQRLHVAQYVFALAVTMCCAMVGSWIALGPGTHGSLPFSSSDGLDMLGRAIFAIGAGVIWLGLIAVAISGWRKRLAAARLDGSRRQGAMA